MVRPIIVFAFQQGPIGKRAVAGRGAPAGALTRRPPCRLSVSFNRLGNRHDHGVVGFVSVVHSFLKFHAEVAVPGAVVPDGHTVTDSHEDWLASAAEHGVGLGDAVELRQVEGQVNGRHGALAEYEHGDLFAEVEASTVVVTILDVLSNSRDNGGVGVVGVLEGQFGDFFEVYGGE